MSYNLPLLAIPAYYLIALIPHAVATSIASGGSLAKHDNRNPTSTELVTKLKTKLPPKRFAKFERCKSCHRNALENFPLFIVAMLAGLYAERETGQQLHLTFYAGLQLIIRLVYTINYSESSSNHPYRANRISQRRDTGVERSPESIVVCWCYRQHNPCCQCCQSSRIELVGHYLAHCTVS